MRRRFLSRRSGRDDSGFTLVELMVSMVLFGIMMTMVVITLGFVLQQSTYQSKQTQSAENSETSLWTLRVPLRYAETPYVASLANPAAGGVTSTSPCWGSSSPSFDPAMPAMGTPINSSAKAAGGADYGVIGSPMDDAILVAHDYDVVFCAQAKNTSATSPAHTYRLWVNPTTCTDHTATGGGGCTLELDDYGTNPYNTCGWSSTSLPSTCSPSPTYTSTSVATDVWCNLSCQQDVVGTLGSGTLTEPAMFKYYTAPGSTTPVFTPSDITSSTGANLPGIHAINISMSTLTGSASATATSTSGVINSTSNVYLGGTVTSSSTVLDSAPVVSSVSPSSGSTAGGNTVTINGTYFTTTGSGVSNVSFCTSAGTVCTAATSFTVLSATQIQATVPTHLAGSVDVVVTNNINGASALSSGDSYTFLPQVTAISPTFGPVAGGTPVTITGLGFGSAGSLATVTFGLVPATSVTVNSNTQISATAPAGVAGVVHVTVTVSSAVSTTSSADQYTYVSVPSVTGIAPSNGSVLGGTSVVITGNNFLGATAVKFGTVNATSYTINSDTQITAVSPASAPAGTLGPVDVTVTAASGTSTTSASDKFTYLPTVTGLNPTYGPTSGGNTVIITGTGFTGASCPTAVKFGGTTATSCTVNSSTQITAKAPAGAVGTVDVTVTASGYTSATSSSDQYTYYSTPTVTGVLPNLGPTAGGNTVTITGTSFVGVTCPTGV